MGERGAAPLSGVLEDDVQNISLSLIGRPPEDMERAAVNVIALSRQGKEERRALAEEGVIHSLTIMCSREFTAKTQAKGALGLAALCSNFSANMDDSKMYVEAAAQQEALNRGAVTLITPILTAWQPDAQAAAANALADLSFRNAEVRRAMFNMDACRPLVNLLHSENMDVHKAALTALRSWAVEAKNAKEIEDRPGALSQVCKLIVTSDKAEVKARALSLLWMLSGSDSAKVKICKEDGGKVLKECAACLKSSDQHVKAAAVALIRRITTNNAPVGEEKSPVAQLFDLGAHMELVTALRNQDEAVKLNCLGALRCIAQHKPEATNVVSNAGDLVRTLEQMAKKRARSKKGDAVAIRAQQLLKALGVESAGADLLGAGTDPLAGMQQHV